VNEPMTPEHFRACIISLTRNDNPEHNHWYTDKAMEDLLISLGYEEGVEIIRKIERWYS